MLNSQARALPLDNYPLPSFMYKLHAHPADFFNKKTNTPTTMQCRFLFTLGAFCVLRKKRSVVSAIQRISSALALYNL